MMKYGCGYSDSKDSIKNIEILQCTCTWRLCFKVQSNELSHILHTCMSVSFEGELDTQLSFTAESTHRRGSVSQGVTHTLLSHHDQSVSEENCNQFSPKLFMDLNS